MRVWDVRKFDVKLGVFVLFRSKRRESKLVEGRKIVGVDVTVSTN
jgi:hypothetical protein